MSAAPGFQPGTVSGKVTSASDGLGVPGVSILIRDSGTGTVTDGEGNYSIPVPEDAVLVFSAIGFVSQEITVGNRSTIDVELSEDVKHLDEVVVVGYGTQKKSDITGANQRLEAAQFETQPTTNLIEMLSGTVAGFNSNQGTSSAGGGSMEIRGQTSIKANNSPLIVLDGVIFNGSINDINPSDVETIDILKDASSAAVYGSRAAAGVLIVTTKRGKTGKPTINFSTSIGLASTTNRLQSFGPEQYLAARSTVLRQVYPNRPYHYYTHPGNLPAEISENEWMNYDVTPSGDPVGMYMNRLILSTSEQSNYLSGKTTDWYDLVFRNGLRQDYNASISGGGNDLSYYWSAGYTNNEGPVVGDGFKKFRSRLNVDATVTDFLKLGVNAQFSNQDNSAVSAGTGTNLIRQSPYGEIYNDDGTIKWYPNEDLIATNPLLNHSHRHNFDKAQALFATLFAEIKLPFGISYRASFQNRYSWSKHYLFDPLETIRGYNNGGFGSRENTSVHEWMVDNLVYWNRTIAEIHNFDVTLLFNVEQYQSWNDVQENFQILPSPALSFHALQAGSNPSLNNNDQYSTGNALMARLNYSLKDRYLMTATWRRDGYSAFGQSNPYAEFPSLALGWRISEESFFGSNIIDDLKLRISWGSNGNRDIGRYEALAKLATTQYLYGNTSASGVNSNSMANSNLKWEKTEAFNLGVDFGILNNRISGSIEAYQMQTTDLLLDRSLPSIIGYDKVTSNLGEVRNHGIEVTINSFNLNRPGRLQWNSSLLFSLNRNEIRHLYGDMVDVTDNEGNVIGQKEADDVANQWFIGQSIDRVWDYDIQGIWQLDEAEDADIYGRVPGDHKLRDVNNDGVLSPLEDKVFHGYTRPQYRLGLRNDVTFMKNFALSVFVRADLGFQRNNPLYQNSHFLDRVNDYAVPYWTPDNPSNEWPRLDPTVSSPSFNVWKNSSFIRVQDISLSYQFPKSKLANLKIQNLKTYVSFRNYFTITSWNHWDPESGATPMPKYASIGLNLTL